MNNFSVLECPVYFDKTNMLDMLSLSAGRAILCQNRDTLRRAGIPRRNTRL